MTEGKARRAGDCAAVKALLEAARAVVLLAGSRCLSTGSCLSFQVADEPRRRAEVASVGLQDLSWEA